MTIGCPKLDCPQQSCGVRLVPPDGLGSNGVMLVGDSPWKDEVRSGRVFDGAAGWLLNSLLTSVGTRRSDWLIANTMWCKPPDLKFTSSAASNEAMSHCRGHLDDLVWRQRPKVIVPLGNVALRRCCGVSDMEAYHGYVMPSMWEGIPAVPTFHPSFLQRGNRKLTPAVQFVLRKALMLARGGGRVTPTTYLLDPTPEELAAYLATSRDPLLYMDAEWDIPKDVEEDEAIDRGEPIYRASVSVSHATAASFTWEPRYLDVLRAALPRFKVVAGHNFFSADLPKMLKQGLPELAAMEIWDSMWAWHWLHSDLLKGLGFVAPFFYDGGEWKSLKSVDKPYYSAVDSDAGRRVMVGTKRLIDAEGRWQGFINHCIRMREPYQTMGWIYIDRERQSAFKARLESELREADAALQTRIPDAVKPLAIRKLPPTADESEWLKVRVEMSSSRRPDKRREPEESLAGSDGSPARWMVSEWRRREPFNSGSSDQKLALIRHFGLKVPQKRGEDRDTTEMKYLKRFARGVGVPAAARHAGACEAFAALEECTKRRTLLNTFIWELQEVPDSPLGIVRTTYGWTPSTWRKSSTSPNLQNGPKRGSLAKDFNKMIVAPPGEVLIEFDSSAIEAVLVGYFAGASDYIRLARCGVHDWLTSHIVGHPIDYRMPDDELRQALKEIKKSYPEEREPAKRTVHGGNYLYTAYGLHDDYEELFPTEAHAQKLLDIYLSLPPVQPIKKWWDTILFQAQRDKYLTTPFGVRHRFYHALKNGENGEKKLGDDAKRIAAFKPQSTGSTVQDVIVWTLWQTWMRDRLRLIIHDSVLASVPEARLYEAAEVMRAAFTQPFPQLGGLWIGAEGKAGRSRGEMIDL